MRRWLSALTLSLACSACTVRYAHNRFDDPALDGQRKGIPYEAGFVFLGKSTPIGRTDFEALLSSQAFWSDPRTVVNHFELSLRFFPVYRGPVRPFVGAGYGRYSFGIEQVYSTCPSGYICFPGQGNSFRATERKNLASGYNGHWKFGAELGYPRAHGAVVIEATQEVNARRANLDFGGLRVGVGLVLRP